MWKTCYYHAANDCLITVKNCIFKTSLPFFKVFYQLLSHRANITAKQNHCRRQYHASGISLPRQQGFPSGRCVVCFSFDQPIVASGSRLSYACILLFPASTQYPAGSPITALLKSHCRGRQCSFAPFLHASTKVSCVGFIIWFPSGGLPRYARNDIVLRTQNNISSNYSRLKRREFDEIVFFSVGFENYSVLGVHEFSSSAEKAKYRELSPFCFTKKISAEPTSAHLAGSPK